MARPKKAPQEKRDDRLNPRLTAAERAEIESHAAALGITPSDFMRRRSLGYCLPATIAAQRATAGVATALIGLGNNVNQITRRMHAGGHDAPPDYLQALADRINTELDRIYGPGADGGRAVL